MVLLLSSLLHQLEMKDQPSSISELEVSMGRGYVGFIKRSLQPAGPTMVNNEAENAIKQNGMDNSAPHSWGRT